MTDDSDKTLITEFQEDDKNNTIEEKILKFPPVSENKPDETIISNSKSDETYHYTPPITRINQFENTFNSITEPLFDGIRNLKINTIEKINVLIDPNDAIHKATNRSLIAGWHKPAYFLARELLKDPSNSEYWFDLSKEMDNQSPRTSALFAQVAYKTTPNAKHQLKELAKRRITILDLEPVEEKQLAIVAAEHLLKLAEKSNIKKRKLVNKINGIMFDRKRNKFNFHSSQHPIYEDLNLQAERIRLGIIPGKYHGIAAEEQSIWEDGLVKFDIFAKEESNTKAKNLAIARFSHLIKYGNDYNAQRAQEKLKQIDSNLIIERKTERNTDLTQEDLNASNPDLKTPEIIKSNLSDSDIEQLKKAKPYIKKKRVEQKNPLEKIIEAADTSNDNSVLPFTQFQLAEDLLKAGEIDTARKIYTTIHNNTAGSKEGTLSYDYHISSANKLREIDYQKNQLSSPSDLEIFKSTLLTTELKSGSSREERIQHALIKKYDKLARLEREGKLEEAIFGFKRFYEALENKFTVDIKSDKKITIPDESIIQYYNAAKQKVADLQVLMELSEIRKTRAQEPQKLETFVSQPELVNPTITKPDEIDYTVGATQAIPLIPEVVAAYDQSASKILPTDATQEIPLESVDPTKTQAYVREPVKEESSPEVEVDLSELELGNEPVTQVLPPTTTLPVQKTPDVEKAVPDYLTRPFKNPTTIQELQETLPFQKPTTSNSDISTFVNEEDLQGILPQSSTSEVSVSVTPKEQANIQEFLKDLKKEDPKPEPAQNLESLIVTPDMEARTIEYFKKISADFDYVEGLFEKVVTYFSSEAREQRKVQKLKTSEERMDRVAEVTENVLTVGYNLVKKMLRKEPKDEMTKNNSDIETAIIANAQIAGTDPVQALAMMHEDEESEEESRTEAHPSLAEYSLRKKMKNSITIAALTLAMLAGSAGLYIANNSYKKVESTANITAPNVVNSIPQTAPSPVLETIITKKSDVKIEKQENEVYTVKKGDTLWNIAEKKYEGRGELYTNLTIIRNGKEFEVTNIKYLKIGDEVKINPLPDVFTVNKMPEKEYTYFPVKKGQTVSSISKNKTGNENTWRENGNVIIINGYDLIAEGRDYNNLRANQDKVGIKTNLIKNKTDSIPGYQPASSTDATNFNFKQKAKKTVNANTSEETKQKTSEQNNSYSYYREHTRNKSDQDTSNWYHSTILKFNDLDNDDSIESIMKRIEEKYIRPSHFRI